jgi:hypothetical protein
VVRQHWSHLSFSQPGVSCKYEAEIDYYFVRERVVEKLLEISFVSNRDQLADGFTKPLSVCQLESFRRNLKLEIV